jgi:hypothetical protein
MEGGKEASIKVGSVDGHCGGVDSFVDPSE